MLRRRWVILLLAGLLIGGGAPVALSVARIRPTVVLFFERLIPGQVTVRSWTVQFKPAVVVVAHGVEIGRAPAVSAGPLFRAQRVELQLDAVRLLLGQLRVARIGLDSPELSQETWWSGWNVEPEARTRREGPRGESGSRASRLVISDPLPIEVHHGRLTFRWGGETRTVSDVGGRLAYAQGAHRMEYRLAWTSGGGARAETSGLVVPRGRESLEIQAHVKSSSDRTTWEATLALDLQRPPREPILSGRVSGNGQTTILPGVRVGFQGSGTGSAALEGPPEAPRVKGSVTVEDGQLGIIGHPRIEALRGRIVWTPEGAEAPKLTGRWGSSLLVARLKAGWGASPPTLRGELSASTIDLAPFLRQITEGLPDRPAPSSRAGGLISSAHAEPSAAAWLPWARRIGVDLRLRVASARLNGEPLGPLHAQVIADAGLWHLQGIRLTLDEGEPSGYVRLDLRRPHPHVTLFAQGPGLALLREGLPEPYRLVAGQLTFETLLQWEGLSWREFRKSVRGQGEFRILDGRVATARLIRHVEIRGIARSGWEEKPLLAFDELWTRYRVAGPRVVTQALALTGRAWEVRGEGVVHLSGQLDFRLTGHALQARRLTGVLQGDLGHPRLVISH